MKNLAFYRELTKKVIAHEKEGFWSDWTSKQQEAYLSGDWVAFSRSRGYTEEEIADHGKWLKMWYMYGGEGAGDLWIECMIKNIKKDKREEILLSSHVPKEELCQE